MGHKAEEAAGGSCKVLPICDVATLGNAGCRQVPEKEAHKRRKAVSRIKELLKSSKSGIKGWKVFYLIRNKMALKEDGARSSNSSKASFRWDVGSCSASSSVFSPMSMPLPSRSDQMWSNNLSATLRTANSEASSLGSPARTAERSSRAAQWIATDSDFVVLEL